MGDRKEGEVEEKEGVLVKDSRFCWFYRSERKRIPHTTPGGMGAW